MVAWDVQSPTPGEATGDARAVGTSSVAVPAEHKVAGHTGMGSTSKLPAYSSAGTADVERRSGRSEVAASLASKDRAMVRRESVARLKHEPAAEAGTGMLVVAVRKGRIRSFEA